MRGMRRGPLRSVLHPVAVHYKGSGFYSTDYGRKKKAAAKDGGASADSSSDGGSSSGDSSGSERRLVGVSGGETKKAAEA